MIGNIFFYAFQFLCTKIVFVVIIGNIDIIFRLIETFSEFFFRQNML